MALAILSAIVFAAYGVEAALGFGCSILAVTAAAHLYPLDVLLPVLVSLNILVSLYIVVRHRKDIDSKTLVRRFLPWMGLGLPAGMVLFYVTGGNTLKIAFGVFVTVLAAVELVRLYRRSAEQVLEPLTGWKGAVTLAAGGVMHGLYASGGPMAVYFASRQYREKGKFRSTLSTLWLVLNVVLIAGYAVKGKVTEETGRMTAVLMVPLCLGILAGEWLHGRLNERTFSALVYILLLAGGAVLVLLRDTS